MIGTGIRVGRTATHRISGIRALFLCRTICITASLNRNSILPTWCSYAFPADDRSPLNSKAILLFDANAVVSHDILIGIGWA